MGSTSACPRRWLNSISGKIIKKGVKSFSARSIKRQRQECQDHNEEPLFEKCFNRCACLCA